MDEAFSALDVLTGERLREDILHLWRGGSLPTQSMLIVSHNIEAVLMADRVLVFAADPGRVRAELAIGLPRPRDRDAAEVRLLIDEVYALMTAGAPGQPAHGGAHAGAWPSACPRPTWRAWRACWNCWRARTSTAAPTSHAWPTRPSCRTTTCCHSRRRCRCWGWRGCRRGDLLLAPLGRHYVESAHGGRQRLFGQQLLEHVPLAATSATAWSRTRTGSWPTAISWRCCAPA